MKKSILNIGVALNLAEQKQIQGGGGHAYCRCTHSGETTLIWHCSSCEFTCRGGGFICSGGGNML